ncbi:MAG: DUF433 domain-containing protein [Anaerolineae bacterium]|nr:DUF433 domain-containing protein [Anaerolineae bacterium]
MTNQNPVATIDLTEFIERRFFGDRPHIRDRRVPVASIAYNAYDGEQWSVSELAFQFTLTETQVLAALLYYQEHKEEIDLLEVAEQAKLDEMHRLYGKQD